MDFEFTEEDQRIFSEGVEALTARQARALAANYDFSQHRSVLDLGGGTGIANVAVAGKNGQRPVIRAAAAVQPAWTITGAANSALLLQGIHLVGADVVLAGEFACVRIRCATLDPGTSGAALDHPSVYAAAVDGQALRPTRLFIEARIEHVRMERPLA